MPQKNTPFRFALLLFAAALLAAAGCPNPPPNNAVVSGSTGASASVLAQTDNAPPIVPSTPPQSDQPGDKPATARTITVYTQTSDKDGNAFLSAKQMPMSGDEARTPAKFALETLLKDPHSPLPAGTTLRKVTIGADGAATADFSHEFKDNFKGGDTPEALAINAVLSTLGQFKSVKTVQFLVEGKKIDSLGGNESLDEPLPVPQASGEKGDKAGKEPAREPSPAATAAP